MLKRVARTVTCTFLLLAATSSVGAQQFTGGVRGAVQDANGVLPGVAVTLTNEATNISRDVVTNDVGQYNFPAVPPGTYTLRSRLTGADPASLRAVARTATTPSELPPARELLTQIADVMKLEARIDR